jgi:hypothetical protein
MLAVSCSLSLSLSLSLNAFLSTKNSPSSEDILEENKSVAFVGLGDGDRIVLIDGVAPVRDIMLLRYLIAREGRADPQVYEISIHKDSTILDW